MTDTAGLKEGLLQIYDSYASKLGLDSAKFSKFCKDSYIFNSTFRPEDVDVLFAKYKEAGKRHLSFSGFLLALNAIADKKGQSADKLFTKIVETNPVNPVNSAPPMPNRFHDDTRTFTGVHKAGGPTIIDSEHRTLSNMVDRTIKSNSAWQGESKSGKGLEVNMTALKLTDQATPDSARRFSTSARSSPRPRDSHESFFNSKSPTSAVSTPRSARRITTGALQFYSSTPIYCILIRPYFFALS